MNRLPIIYVRGYAGGTAGIDAQVDDPFYGFNKGATHVRVGAAAEPQYYQFEGPMLRLMKDHDYQLIVNGDQRLYLQRAAAASIAPDSLWVYRFYDQAATTFAAPSHPGVLKRVFTDIRHRVSAPGFNIESAAEGLLELIELLREKVNAEDKRVIVVAHSMGGLVARCMMQKIAIEQNRNPKDLVAKFFTYGTPHGGIVFDNAVMNWFQEVVGPAGSEIFAPQKMFGYLEPGREFGDEPKDGQDWDPQAMPDNVIDKDNVFCLIGTNAKDYGVSRKVVGPRSDGLVRIEHAYIRFAHRAFVYRSHSGSYGEVNSEEGYQNLQRFLFGRWKVAVELVGLPAELEEPALGAERPVWQADVRLAIRGLPVLISEQRTDHYNPIQLNQELGRLSDSPDHPIPLVTTFLFDPGTQQTDTSAFTAVDDLTRYSLTLRVLRLNERDDSFDFTQHLEQVFDWADSAIFDVGSNSSGDGLQAWANWSSGIDGALEDFNPRGSQTPRNVIAVSEGKWNFELDLPPAAQSLTVIGQNGKLRVTVVDRHWA